DGFRVATWAPEPGMGAPLAAGHETGVMNYDRYCGLTSATTAIDMGNLVDALAALIANPAVRRTLGDAGRRRARELFDWPVVYRQYQALWTDLNARRATVQADPVGRARLAAAPSTLSANLDPFDVFGHYPTRQIGPATVVSLAPGATRDQLTACLDHPLFGGVPSPKDLTLRAFAAVEAGDATPAIIAIRLNYPVSAIGRTIGQLAKMGMVRLG
ncbi:hypothetical protein, partial [Phenylobacterium sp.]|uniref:hypothetical protein n=1 Tax=Phenylobacterium sp. TaxID=1871053 RepID=UPI0038F74EF9